MTSQWNYNMHRSSKHWPWEICWHGWGCWQKIWLKICSQPHSFLKVKAVLFEVKPRTGITCYRWRGQGHVASGCATRGPDRMSIWRSWMSGKRLGRKDVSTSKKWGAFWRLCTCWWMTMNSPSWHWVFQDTDEHINMSPVETSECWHINCWWKDSGVPWNQLSWACCRLHMHFTSGGLSYQGKAGRLWPPNGVWCNQETRRSAPDQVSWGSFPREWIAQVSFVQNWWAQLQCHIQRAEEGMDHLVEMGRCSDTRATKELSTRIPRGQACLNWIWKRIRVMAVKWLVCAVSWTRSS